MSWILIGGAVMCSWAMLRTIGAERERCVIEGHRADPQPQPQPPPPMPAQKAAFRTPGPQHAKRAER